MADVHENMSDTGVERWVDLAYVRLPSGREFSTVVDNIEAA